ncbi:MAG TPA: PEP-CTERM sorting domain-containing protein [Tepidisphaeraceae bacterium]|jgi:MYXO-CTERM domain-containing protein
MKVLRALVTVGFATCFAGVAQATVVVTTGTNADTTNVGDWTFTAGSTGYASMGAPSNSDDLAEGKTITLAAGSYLVAGTWSSLAALTDGSGGAWGTPSQTAEVMVNNESLLQLDLGASVTVGSVSSFSTYTDTARTSQNYTLWGGSSSATTPSSAADLTAPNGWTSVASPLITYNNTTHSGSTITDTSGALGSYRYLLWEIKNGTYGETAWSEFDVTSPTPEPAALGLFALGGLAMLRRRK